MNHMLTSRFRRRGQAPHALKVVHTCTCSDSAILERKLFGYP
jgi:hypothetical protein